MVRDVAVLLIAMACWAGFFYKLRHLRQRASGPGGPALRALAFGQFTLAGALTLDSGLVARAVDAATGVPGSARLGVNSLSMGSCLAVIAWLLYLSLPADMMRARLAVHARVMAGAVAMMLAMFVIDHPAVTPDAPFVGAYNYPYLAFVVYIVVPVTILFWQYAAKNEPPMMRLGLRLASIGSGLGVASMIVILLYLIGAELQWDLPGSTHVAAPLYTAAAVGFVVGIALPAVGPRLGLEALWWRVGRAYATRRLRPLWRTVAESCPGVVLDRDLLAASPVGERLEAERMPVEILDSWITLRCYLRSSDLKLISERAPKDDASIAAARLMLAIRRKQDGEQPAPVQAGREHLRLGAGTTLLSDVRFLCAVSRKLRCRSVREVLITARAQDDATCPDSVTKLTS